MEKTAKPDYMYLLECRGIHARGYFRFRDTPDECYAVTRGYRIYRMDGEPAALTENELWERYEQLERISRETYDTARRKLLGQPAEEELSVLAERFVREYGERYTEGAWRILCSYDEETLRKVLEQAAKQMEPENHSKQKALFRNLFREIALARAQRPK